ncbi:MAG: aspartate ammonia-lyase [Armatimonadota bacterium]|nr:aspartate ammonia-lyase [Armatimonadota bacterium]
MDEKNEKPLNKNQSPTNTEGSNSNSRIERDWLGEKEVPADALYGIHTVRALENFPISGQRAIPEFITALAMVKKAATVANMRIGRLNEDIGIAIRDAADEIINGKWHDQIVVDVFQAGAGTSLNMNINEVIANRALELLNLPKGKYDIINPNDHVNMSQSSNDVFPTAMRITALNLGGRLLEALSELEDVLWSKADEFDHVLKSARTHLRDAVPIRLGQEFGAYAVTIGKVSRHVHIAMENLKELNIGGTAVGTGINSTIAYRVIALEELKKYTSMEDLRPPESWVEVTQSAGDFLDISGAIRDTAVALMKIAGDITLMYSGPMTGLAEIDMPVTQAGSSIIPGKVNPSMAEMLEMVCCQVIGNGTTIVHAARSGRLDLNPMTPVIARNLFESLIILRNAISAFTEKALRGIVANENRCRAFAENSLGLATALSPKIGYHAASIVAQEALLTGKSIREIVIETGLLTPEELDVLLKPESLTEPGIPGQ